MDQVYSWIYFCFLYPAFKRLVCLFLVALVFVAVCRLFLVAESGGCARASHCGGFSCCEAQTPGLWVSVVSACGLSSYGIQA